MIKTPKTIISDYKSLLDNIPEIIKESGYKDLYIFQKMGMEKTAFYRRKSNPSLWTFEELDKLFNPL